jgi:sugar O-acyltransferase (sialic acid O-acetyltransferase NeuD family)
VKPLAVYGASNFGDEIVQLFRDINAMCPEWELLGFLDDDPDLLGRTRVDLPVLGDLRWLEEQAPRDIHVVVAIGNPVVKRRVAGRVAASGARFATGVHPTVVTSEYNTIGSGTVVCAGSVLTTNIRVGDHVILNLSCTVGHNSVIGDHATVNPIVAISGDVTVEEAVLLGTGAAVVDKVRIGRGAIIGAGATVTRDIEPFATAVGTPAVPIKVREDDLD